MCGGLSPTACEYTSLRVPVSTDPCNAVGRNGRAAFWSSPLRRCKVYIHQLHQTIHAYDNITQGTTSIVHYFNYITQLTNYCLILGKGTNYYAIMATLLNVTQSISLRRSGRGFACSYRGDYSQPRVSFDLFANIMWGVVPIFSVALGFSTWSYWSLHTLG